MGGTIFHMNLEEMSFSSVQDYIHSKVKEIKVVTRTVDIPIVKYLGAQHMFLVLKLEGGIRVVNHLSDDNGGKGAKVVFQRLPQQDEDDDKHTVVLNIELTASVTLQDIISKAKSYQIEHPTYEILSKNCQFYCISILKKLHVNKDLIQKVSIYSEDNIKTSAIKGAVGLGVVVGGTLLAFSHACKDDKSFQGKEKRTKKQLIAQQ
ncbi:hypothetical protein ABPG72_018547 [Tetrahymena utriculariae]